MLGFTDITERGGPMSDDERDAEELLRHAVRVERSALRSIRSPPLTSPPLWGMGTSGLGSYAPLISAAVKDQQLCDYLLGVQKRVAAEQQRRRAEEEIRASRSHCDVAAEHRAQRDAIEARRRAEIKSAKEATAARHAEEVRAAQNRRRSDVIALEKLRERRREEKMLRQAEKLRRSESEFYSRVDRREADLEAERRFELERLANVEANKQRIALLRDRSLAIQQEARESVRRLRAYQSDKAKEEARKIAEHLRSRAEERAKERSENAAFVAAIREQHAKSMRDAMSVRNQHLSECRSAVRSPSLGRSTVTPSLERSTVVLGNGDSVVDSADNTTRQRRRRHEQDGVPSEAWWRRFGISPSPM